MLGILSQIETEFNWLPITPFLHVVYMHGTRLTFGKAFVRKQYAILKFFREDSQIDFFYAKRLGVGVLQVDALKISKKSILNETNL